MIIQKDVVYNKKCFQNINVFWPKAKSPKMPIMNRVSKMTLPFVFVIFTVDRR